MWRGGAATESLFPVEAFKRCLSLLLVIWFVVALIPSSLQGLAEPTLKSTMSRRVSEAQQGQLQGAIQSVAGIAGPIFFGWVYAMSSLTLPGLSFLIAASVLVLAALFSAGSNVNAGNKINETSV